MKVRRHPRAPMMKVRDLMTPGLVETHPAESLTDVADRMRRHRVGAIAITEGEALVGIITERDLMRALADGLSPRVTPASAYMTPSPGTISAGADASEAAARMLEGGHRHLPVTEAGRVVGVLSSRDLLRVSRRLPADLRGLAYEPW